MIDLNAGGYTISARFGAAFEADNTGGDMLGLGISLTRANLSVSGRTLDFTTGSLPAGVTFTRAGSATYFDAAGVLRTAAADQPRLDYDPVTKAPKGLLIEESRTNLLLNSATLATQSVTTTAQTYTLTFYGTGSVALSGAYTGNLVGTGASNRVKLTFTATDGTLTLTVTGSVTSAQLEAGAFPTSYIPTTNAAATRAADVCLMIGADFSRWFNPVEGTIVAEFSTGVGPGIPYAATAYDIDRAAATDDGYRLIMRGSVPDVVHITKSGGVEQASASVALPPAGQTLRVATAYKTNDVATSINGGAVSSDATVTLPTVDRMALGSQNAGGFGFLNGHIRRLRYYPIRLDNARLQELSA